MLLNHELFAYLDELRPSTSGIANCRSVCKVDHVAMEDVSTYLHKSIAFKLCRARSLHKDAVSSVGHLFSVELIMLSHKRLRLSVNVTPSQIFFRVQHADQLATIRSSGSGHSLSEIHLHPSLKAGTIACKYFLLYMNLGKAVRIDRGGGTSASSD